MHPSRLVRGILAPIVVLTSTALAIPTAVNDAYTTPEDTAVAGVTVQTPILITDFEAGSGSFPLSASWDYLDTIPPIATTYPSDGAAVSWKATAFNKTTSTVAGWKSAALPIQGAAPGVTTPGVDAFTAAPNILLGITGGGAANTVTTYLLRTTFTMTAAQAATAWTARVLADDGCIIYVNGVEAGRLNYPAATAVSPDQYTPDTISETAYTNVMLTVPFVAGTNCIAVELHQSTATSSDAGLDMSLIPATSDPLQGLTYVDDVDGTNRPPAAAGGQDTAGNPGGSINIGLSRGFFGGGSGNNVSGGWRKTIAVPTAGTLRIKCDARGRTVNLEDNEFVEAIVMLDGARLTIAGRNYLVRRTGPNPAASPAASGSNDTGWGSYTLETSVAAGNHVITFGGFGPRPSSENNDFGENGTVNFDNIDVTLIATGGSLLDNDTGGVAPVTAVKVADPAHGTVTINPTGSFSYAPQANYFGTDTFTYKAVDGTGESAPATVTITIQPVNDPPIAVNDGPFSTPQGQALVVPPAQSVLLNDSDIDSPSITAVIATQSPNGNTVLNADGSFTFTPAAQFAGTTTFTYRASDGLAQSAPATVTINVMDAPDPPTAVNDTYTAVKNTPLVVTATTPSTTTETIQPLKAAGWHYFDSLVLAERNLGTAWRTTGYVEGANWKIGPAELGYGDGDEGTTINDNPDPAFVSTAADKFATYYFRHSINIPDLQNVTGLLVDAVFDDGIVIFMNGTEIARNTGLAGQGTELAWDYFSGNASNNEQASQAWTLPVTTLVEGANLLAAEVHQTAATSSDVSMDVQIRVTRLTPAGVLANDTDPDAGQTATLVAEIVAQPAHGAVTLNTNGTFTYTPVNGYTGADAFTYRAKDTTNLTSAVATANISIVSGPNAAPVANPDTYVMNEDGTLAIDEITDGVLANDTDAEADPFTAVLATAPAHGSLTLNPNGTFSYIPVLNFAGTDSFTYRANDGRASAPATATITVNPVNDAPVSQNDSYSGDPGVPFVIAAAQGVLANDSDVDAGTTLTAELITPPASGTLTLNPDGSFTFTVAQGGVYTFTYRAKDATTQSAPATVTIALNAVPVTLPDAYSVDEDQILNALASEGHSVLANDNDPEGQPLTAILVTTVQHGVLSLTSGGGFQYTPASNYFGPDSFTYRASDGTRTSAPVTVTLTVNAVNDAPVATADTYSVHVDLLLDIAAANGVLRNDTDVDNSSLLAGLVTPPLDGTLVLRPDGSFTYMPAAGFSGTRSFTYRASDGTLLSPAVTVTLNVTADLNTIVISEIMYNPPGATGVPEEFLEIYNYGDAAVDLTGWEFTKGVNFIFPAGTLIASHGYLAIPANKATFTAKYPAVTNVTTTAWGVLSNLSNGGELLRLKNAAGDIVEEVTYADQGDWAVRKIVNVWRASNTPGAVPAAFGGSLGTDPGLEWVTAADPNLELSNAGGSSLQLRNAALTTKCGQNWTAAAPTPGAANTAAAQTDSAPLIREVLHSPAVPDHTQQVYVTAKITDELLTGYSASVFYRTWLPAGTTPATAFSEVAMADNGLRGDGAANDGVFGAVIPAQALNTVVEFYVHSVDAAANARTWPAPTLDINGATPVQNANCLYQVNEETWTDHRPFYQIVMTGADNASWNAGLNSRQVNVAPNCTVVFRHGGQFEVRYLGGIRTRGNSSRSDTPLNLRLDIPGDNPWNGRTGFTLNYKYAYSQYLSSRLMECAGIPCEKAGMVGMRLNGANRLLDQNANRTFGYYCDLIPRGGDTISAWFPGDTGGNGYGKIRGSVRWGVSTLPTIGTGGLAVGGYVNQGYWKQSNVVQNDWTDLHAWLTAMNAGTSADFDTVIAGTVDVDEWCRFFALSTIINHAETNPANGDDDDYSTYFGADRRCRIMAHDMDTSFNLNAIGLGDEVAAPTATIYQTTDPNYPGGDSATLTQMDKFYRNPVTGRKYKATLRYYLDTLFLKPNFDATVDRLLDSQWMGTQFTPNGDAIRTHIKTFLDARRTTIETYLPTAFTATTTLAVQNGYARSTSATDLGALGGKIDPARTAEVRVNGTKVTTNPYGSTAAADNTWSAGTAITLKPGLNTLLCTAQDEHGSIFASQTVSIWLDTTGTNKAGAIAANETWTAAGGPYNVTASLSISNGAALTIEPGTTVFMASGASLTVAAGGRLIAAGTAASGITIVRNPSGTGSWGNLTINGTNALPSILSYVTFANNGSVAVHGQNAANIQCDHLTFQNTAVGYLSFDGCSFTVSDCIFPDGTAGFEPVHGTAGIPAGGHGIVQRCAFGKPVGYNDSFDFTGGNRPGPILHVLNCTFNGSEDDMLDLDSTDAWIEGCTFIHCHRNGASPDSSSGVSGGADNADASQCTIINCLFYDCDNAVTMKQGNQPNGNSAVLLYNTIVHITKTGGIDNGSGVVNFDDDNVAGEGKGMYLEGNIIWDVENLTRNYVAANSNLTLVNNLLPVAPPAGSTASGNILTDPLLHLSLISTPATATLAQVAAALQPQPCSPIYGVGLSGRDLGPGYSAFQIQQLPGLLWPASISLGVGPGGSFTPTGQAAWPYGSTHYRYALDSAPITDWTPVATPITLTGLANGQHTLTVYAREDSGIESGVGHLVYFTVAADAPTIVLSEINAAPSTGLDWIELHNYGTAPATLAGCSLSAAHTLPVKYTFPAAATIPPGGYLLVDTTQLGYNLNRSGEIITLASPSGGSMDTVTFGPQITDRSLARIGFGWSLSLPTPAAPNTAVCELGTGALLRINEWLGSNNLIVATDFVELYNAETKPVSIAGWHLTQDFRNAPAANPFPPNSFLPASGFLALIADGNRLAGPDHLDFKVSSIRDDITLLSPAGIVIDHVFVLPGNPDVSQGRTPDGSATTAYLPLPTPGFSNGSDLTADTAVMNGLRITEIMFAPPGSAPEFIEFKNISAAPLTITGVNFASGISFTFPATTLPSGGYTVITNVTPAAFAARYPGVAALQWASGRLDNNGETIRLETGTYDLGILDFRYEGNWYPQTRTGASLEIIDPTAPRSTWGESTRWQPCVPSPGGPSLFGVAAPADLSILTTSPAILHGLVCPGAHPAASITVAWTQVSGPGTVNFTAPANKDTDATFTAPGFYELRLTATPPGGAPPASDTVIVTVGESYATWAARTLLGSSPAQQAPSADPDNDGIPNAIENILGTNPAAPSAGPELTYEDGHLGLRYAVNKLSDPAIQIIPQISNALGPWQDGAAFINDFLVDETPAATTRIAQDATALGGSVKKFMRLKVIVPAP